MRRSWVIDKTGSLRNLRLEDQALPTLQCGQALVKVHAIGLNFADVFSCLGLYSAFKEGYRVPGLEFSGEILQLADASADAGPTSAPSSTAHQAEDESVSKNKSFKVGDRVMGVTRFGAFSSHLTLDVGYLMSVPGHWSCEEAASYPVQTVTAAYGLWELGNLKPQQHVLVQSAAGGVGLQTLNILKRSNCCALGLVGSQDKVEFLESIFASSKDSFSFAVRADSPAAFEAQLESYKTRHGIEGFDVVLDSVAGDFFQPSYEALVSMGRHIIFGAAALTPPAGECDRLQHIFDALFFYGLRYTLGFQVNMGIVMLSNDL